MAKSKKVFRSPKLARRQARKRRSTVAERRKKEFLWRGYSMDELKTMPLYPPDEEPDALSIVALLPSRAREVLCKGPIRGMREASREVQQFIRYDQDPLQGDVHRPLNGRSDCRDTQRTRIRKGRHSTRDDRSRNGRVCANQKIRQAHRPRCRGHTVFKACGT